MANPSVAMPRASRAKLPIRRVGFRSRPLDDLYHRFLSASWSRLLAVLAVAYLAINGLFALAYLAGDHAIANAQPGSFADAYFFSVQTLSTIGYGNMFPRTRYAELLVTLEAFSGLLGFAVATGVMFAKFARPTARVLFSRCAVIQRREGAPFLLLRMANARRNQIVEAQLRLALAINEVNADGEAMRRFYDLGLSRERNVIFALTWTAMHPIDASSPLFGATAESLRAAEAHVIVSLVGIDETFNQTVHARHAYAADEILWGARFVDIISELPDGTRLVDYTHFHETAPAPL